MKSLFRNLGRLLLLGTALILLCHPEAAKACAACFGESGSPMSAGLNMGVIALFGVVVSVLAGISAFFVYLAKRAAKMNAAEAGVLQEKEVSDDPYGLFQELPGFGK